MRSHECEYIRAVVFAPFSPFLTNTGSRSVSKENEHQY